MPTDSTIKSTVVVVVEPEYITISPETSDVGFGDTVVLSSYYDNGDRCNSHWYIDGEQVANNTSSYTFTADSIGTTVITAKWSFYPNVTTTASVTVTDSGTTDPDPEPSESPEPSPEPDNDYVTNPEMDASQSAQTSTIIASIESESNIIQSAIKSLENTLSNSAILDYFKQSLIFRDFDFATGELSTTETTYEGFVPLFGHWAQNVENYLGQLVADKGNEKQEAVKKETAGFWDILLGLFTPNAETGKATANADDMNSIVSFSSDIRGFFNTGGNISDFVTVVNDDSTWAWFSDEAAADLDTTVITYDRCEPIRNYYAENYSSFYTGVLGREWEGS